MTRRSDRAGIDLFDIPAADPLTAQQQIEPGYADNHTACQQNPLLMGIYETADKREGEQSQGRVKRITAHPTKPYRQSGHTSAGQGTRDAQQSERAHWYRNYNPDYQTFEKS